MTYEQAAFSWTEHLRRGGSTTWREWQHDPDVTVPAAWRAPGAAQLELVRRLADRGGAVRGFTELADLTLGRSGPGRGLAAQPLSWAGGPGTPRFGPPPVDPADVPLDELLRLGVGVLVELLLRSPSPPADRSRIRRRPFARSPAFLLDGAPVTTAVVRRDLVGAGHVEGGRSPTVLLLAEPLDRALVQAWSVRVQRGGSARWHGFLDRWATRRRLPASIDVARLAEGWAQRVGEDRVHVIAAPGSFADAVSAVTELLDLTAHPGPVLPPTWRDLPPEAVDALRRVNGLLGVRATKQHRAGAVRTFVRLHHQQAPEADLLALPDRHLAWARDAAERMAVDLTTGGYPVHGRLEGLVPDAGPAATRPSRRSVLEVVIWACLQLTTADRDGTDDEAPGGKAAT
jgi:hypothetical protein